MKAAAAAALYLLGTLAAFAATPARIVLPTDAVARHYNILVTPDAAHARFHGEVRIALDIRRPTARIVLNAADLTFSKATLSGLAAAARITVDAAAETATFTFAAPIPLGAHVLTIAYDGKINQHPAGLFYLDYDSPAGKKRALFTQFENSDARRFLPCWDEPALKATFYLSAIVPSGLMALSNTPIASRSKEANGLDRVSFAPTPQMSSYLLFFGLGDFERVSKEVDGVDVGVVVKRGEKAKAAYALDAAAHILPFYEAYFGVKYPLPKLDLIAGPGQSQFFSAMENWGAIFYFERALLIDPKISTAEDRLYVYLVVAHEMAHQWFGDLVTMAWWDDLWLNEGFASWMEMKAADHFHPEWKLWLRAQGDKQGAMTLDAQGGTHPIIQPIANVLQANEAFDGITYSKGMAVIRMLENYVGEDTFRSGVRGYIKAHAYGNTVTDDLWQQIDKVAAAPITQVAHDFTLQAGVPLIRVAKTGKDLRLTQDRFAVDASGRAPTSWHVPVVAKSSAGKAWHGLVSRRNAASAPANGTPVVNVGQAGYYHTLYAPPLIGDLADHFAELGAADQLGLLRDSAALGLAGYEPLADTLLFGQRAKASTDPLVLTTLADAVAALVPYYQGLPGKAAYQDYGRKLLAPSMTRLGWIEAAGEDPNVTILRNHLLSALGTLDDPAVLAKAQDLFQTFVRDHNALSAELRGSVLRIVAAHADEKTWSQLHDLAKAARTTLEKQQYYILLGTTHDRALARKALAITLTNEADVSQRPSILRAVSRYFPDDAFAFMTTHPDLIQSWLEPDSRNRFPAQLLSSSMDAKAIGTLQAYAARHIPPSARRPVDMAVAQIAYAAKIRKERLPDVDRWLASHH